MPDVDTTAHMTHCPAIPTTLSAPVQPATTRTVISSARRVLLRGGGSALYVLLLLVTMQPVLAQDHSPALQVRTAQSAVRDASTLPWKSPPAARLEFDVRGKYKGFAVQTDAWLHWQPSGSTYSAMQSVRIPLVGPRSQSSSGTLGTYGPRPQRFTDQGRKRNDLTTLDAASGLVRFSRGTPDVPWQSGMQDRLSVFFQLAGWLAAAGEGGFAPGTQFRLKAASARHVGPWTFRVEGSETLSLGAGSLRAVKLRRITVAGEKARSQAQAKGQTAPESALWLSPDLGWLPVRIHLADTETGDAMDMQLRTYPEVL